MQTISPSPSSLSHGVLTQTVIRALMRSLTQAVTRRQKWIDQPRHSTGAWLASWVQRSIKLTSKIRMATGLATAIRFCGGADPTCGSCQ